MVNHRKNLIATLLNNLLSLKNVVFLGGKFTPLALRLGIGLLRGQGLSHDRRGLALSSHRQSAVRSRRCGSYVQRCATLAATLRLCQAAGVAGAAMSQPCLGHASAMPPPGEPKQPLPPGRACNKRFFPRRPPCSPCSPCAARRPGGVTPVTEWGRRGNRAKRSGEGRGVLSGLRDN